MNLQVAAPSGSDLRAKIILSRCVREVELEVKKTHVNSTNILQNVTKFLDRKHSSDRKILKNRKYL